MGGNARAINFKTKEVKQFAHPIDLTTLNRQELCQNVVSCLEGINDMFKKRFGNYLWSKEVSIRDMFNGSSKFLFSSLSDWRLSKHKPILGDFDVMIPKQKCNNLFVLLKELEDKNITPNMSFVGQCKEHCYGQINGVFKLEMNNTTYFPQIDFEPVDFSNLDFYRFSHSSEWSDVEMGLKGVAHKYLLINLVRTISNSPNLQVLTNTSGITKETLKLSRSSKEKRLWAFSISNGFREKYKKVCTIDGIDYYKELETKDSNYITDKCKIFRIIFSKKVYTFLFESFVGLAQLINENIDQKYFKDLFDNVFDQLWGKNAQGLVRNNPNEDFKIKMKIMEVMLKYLDIDQKINYIIDIMTISNYYQNYKMMEIEE